MEIGVRIATIGARKGADPETSWTAKLLSKGPEKCAEKFGEEAIEALSEQGIQVFLEFAESILPQSVLRAAITSAYRRPETEAVPMLLEQARLPKEKAEATQKLAMSIAEKLRNQKNAGGRQGLVQGLLQEFSQALRVLHHRQLEPSRIEAVTHPVGLKAHGCLEQA